MEIVYCDLKGLYEEIIIGDTHFIDQSLKKDKKGRDTNEIAKRLR